MVNLFNLKKSVYTFAFFSIFFLIGVIIFNDYGISIDEDNTRIIGFVSLEKVFTLFQSDYTFKINEIISSQKSAHSGLETSGVIFDLPMAFIELIFNIEDSRSYYLLRHFFNFSIFFISVYFFYLILLKRYDSWAIAIIGSLFLILSPRIFANSFYNNKDLIFMSLSIIGLYSSINLLETKNLKNIIIFSLVSALMINLRILGIILPILIFLIYIVDIYKNKDFKKKLLYFPLLFLFFTTIFLIIFWPHLWENPIDHFLSNVKGLTSHNLDIYTFYLGKFISTSNPSWHYSIIWIFVSTPILYVLLFLIGLIIIIKNAINIWLKEEHNNSYFNFWTNKKEMYDIIFLLALIIPLCVVTYFGSISYDGWRHLYFVYPSFILIGISGLFEIEKKYFKSKKKILYISVLILLTPTIYWMCKNHPYQYVYFNNFAGKKYNENFEMDYFGVSNKDLLENVAIESNSKIKVYNLSTTDLHLSKTMIKKYLRDKIEIVDNIDKADYLTNNYRDWTGKYYPTKFLIPENFEILYQIKIDDVSINTIYKKR